MRSWPAHCPRCCSSRACSFRGFGVGLAEVSCGIGREGLQHHIAQLTDAGAVGPSLGKTQDARGPVLVAAGVVPALVDVVGAGLHKAEGEAGPRKGVARAIGADKGIHEAGIVRSLPRGPGPAGAQGKSHEQHEQESTTGGHGGAG